MRQRCWVHFLRDLHALTEAHPQDAAVQAWARQVRGVYDAARAWQTKARTALARLGKEAGNFGYGVFARQGERKAFADQYLPLYALSQPLYALSQPLYALSQPFLPASCPEPKPQTVRPQTVRPQTVLSKRIESFLPELFVFVEHVEVPSENTAAERSVRPCVIGRKMSGGTRSASGGTRSAKGSATKATLLSLFGTWQVQGQDALEACRQMLLSPASDATAQPA